MRDSITQKMLLGTATRFQISKNKNKISIYINNQQQNNQILVVK